MKDFILKFPDRVTAVQFGLANGFATIDNENNEQITLASHEYALHIIGEHNGDGQWWVLFRDLVGIPIPEGGEQFIYWSSDWTVEDEAGNDISIPRPESEDVPNVFWA